MNFLQKKVAIVFVIITALFMPYLHAQQCGNEHFHHPPVSNKFPCPISSMDNQNRYNFGDIFYSPNEFSEVLQIRANVHVMQYSSNDPRNFTNSAADVATIERILGYVNSESLRNGSHDELCGGQAVPNSPLSTDTKIELVLNEIYYHVDPVGWRNNEQNANVLNYYGKNNYVDNTPLDDNSLNIFFTEPQNTTIRGWGPGYINEQNNCVVMFNIYSGLIMNGGSLPEWNFGRFLAHEVGHCLGLGHTWNDKVFEYTCGSPKSNQDWGSGGNLMMGYGESATYNTQLQAGHMRRVLTQTWRSKQLINPNPACVPARIRQDYTIVKDDNDASQSDFETLSFEQSYCGDIIVENNSTLTIKGNLYMAEDAKIIVEEGSKLILDGGLITSCNGKWRGIKVHGGSGQIAVETKNNATIENTKEAAVSMFASGGWLLGNGNAIVNLDNTIFNDCKRMLEMGSKTFQYNSSVINNCTQNNGKWGVTNWNCFGVQVTGNTFFNITNECIVTDRGQYNIYNNTVHSQQADILFANVSPGIGNNIELNQLNGAYTGIRSLGASLGDNQIVENQLFADEFDVFMDGDNHYSIKNNDITADYGVVSINNSFYSNTVSSNQFNGNFVGLLPEGDNNGYVFIDNCFQTSYADTYIEGQIFQVQAKLDGAEGANNCFTHQGVVTSSVYDITGNPNPFTYVEPNDLAVDCRDAVKAHSNVNRTQQGQSTNSCDNAGTGNGVFPEPINPCNPKKDIAHTSQAIQWLINRINQIANDANLTPSQKAKLISIYQRCLNRVQGLWVELMFKAGRYDEVRDYYTGQNTDEAILNTYASFVAQADYISAKAFLNGISRTEVYMQDYIWVQLLDLKRLQNDLNYTATPTELSVLETIARKSHPYAGYAKALYYWFTETIIESDLPQALQSIPRSELVNDGQNVNISVYPNPFNTSVSINVGELDGVTVVVADLLGQEFFKGRIEGGQLTISTSEWPQGIYLSSFYENDKILYQKKMVLVK